MQKKLIFSVVLGMVSLGLLLAIAPEQKTLENYQLEAFTPDNLYKKEWKEVEAKLDSNLPKSALKIIEVILSKSIKGQHHKHIIKAINYKLDLQARFENNSTDFKLNYLNKIDSALSFPSKEFVRLMYAEELKSYYNSHYWELEDNDNTGSLSKNYKEWNKQLFIDTITAIHQKVLLHSNKLQHLSTHLFDSLSSAEVKAYPTLYDVFANKILTTQMGFNNRNISEYVLSKELSSSIFQVEEEFMHTPLNIDKEKNYFIISLFQELEKFHSNKKPQSAYLNTILRRLSLAKDNFDIADEKEIYRGELVQLTQQFENNYFLDQVYSQLANEHTELGNTEKHSANYKMAVDYLNHAKDEASKHGKDIREFNNLMDRIKAPYVSLTTEKQILPNQPFLAKVTFKNLQNNQKEHFIYYKIYQHTVNGMKSYNKAQQKGIDTNILKKCTTHKIKLFNKHDYNEYSTFIDFPAQASGFYTLIVSSKEDFIKERKNGKLAESFLQINSLHAEVSMVASATTEITIKNRENGLPVKNAKVSAYEYHYWENEKNSLIHSGKTDSNGVDIMKKEEANNISFLVEYNNEMAVFNDYYYIYKDEESNQTINKIFTDRAIYRPGQTCYFKVISTSQKNEAFASKPEITLLKNKPVSISLEDANYEDVSDTVLTTNEFGSCSGNFKLPEGRMNGSWHIKVGDQYTYIQVEEYKRPKFEVTLNTPKGEYKLNDSVTVSGKAIALSGAAISNQKVILTVNRERQYYYSWCWWRQPRNQEITNIDEHEVTTNEKGEFTYTFFALSPKKKEDAYYTFSITARVTDLTGESREDNTSISIGDKAMEIALGIGETVEKNSDLKFKINSTNLQHDFTDASGTYEIEALEKESRITRNNIWGAIDTLLNSESEFYNKFPLEKIQYNTIEKQSKGSVISSGKFNTLENKTLDLSSLKSLPNGKYRIKLKSADKYGTPVESEQEFLLFDKNANQPAINVDHWISKLKTEGEPGEKAAFVLASSFENAHYTIILINDNKREWIKKIILNNSQQLIEIPITENHRGGISVQISMTINNRTYQEYISIQVPYSNKRLDVKFETFRDKLTPGQAEKWKLVLSGPEATKVSAEMLASMYDAALDELGVGGYGQEWNNHIYETTGQNSSYLFGNNFRYNQTNSCSLGNDNIYINSWNYRYANLGSYGEYKTYGWGEGDDVNEFRAFKGNVLKDESKKMIAMEAPAAAEYTVTVSDSKANSVGVFGFSIATADSTMITSQKRINSNAPLQLRKNFNETAFFYPHLRTNREGEIIIEFTLPESLTRWKFRTWSHTQELLTGFTTKDIVAQKDLMITSFAPRFFRANDQIVFSAKLDNISEEKIDATTKLQLLNAKTMQPLNTNIATLNVAVKAKSSEKAEWSFSVPEDVDAIVCRISAESPNFKDGEEIIIPVLKNKMLVRETMPFTIYSGEEESFEFQRMKDLKSSTLSNHQYTVEFTANPAWSAVQSMPYLAEYPYECAEQTFSRVFANAITRHIMNSSPKIKAIYAEWEKTSGSADALISALDKNPELKSVLLKETPWVNEAQDETEAKRRLAKLFNGKELDKNISLGVKRLMDLENNGWSWFDGGRASFYITEHIVGGFGHLTKLNVSEELFKDHPSLKGKLMDGIEFLDKEVNTWHQEEIKRKYIMIPTPSYEIVHYLYSRSFYPSKSKYENAFAYYKKNVKANWTKYNLQNQAMIALAFFRMGDVEFANAIMKSLKERSSFTKEMGMFWKENESSYYWWTAPIETHSLLIEAFAEVSNDKEAVEKMRLWLLRNKQTNAWNSTKSTALACYALLLQGSDWLSTDNALQVQIGGKALIISNQYTTDNNPYTVQSEAGTGYVKTAWQGKEIDQNKLSNIKVKNNGPSVAFGAAHWEYFEQLDKITTANNTPLKVRKEFYRINGNVIENINSETKLHVGDKIKVRLYVSSDRAMEFIHLRDMRASAFEPTDVVSEYHYTTGAWYYQSVKDAAVDFFFDKIEVGEHQLEYEMTVTHKGTFSNGISTIECMYAPEFSAHTQGINVVVE